VQNENQNIDLGIAECTYSSKPRHNQFMNLLDTFFAKEQIEDAVDT